MYCLFGNWYCKSTVQSFNVAGETFLAYINICYRKIQNNVGGGGQIVSGHMTGCIFSVPDVPNLRNTEGPVMYIFDLA